jgi:hypothetical protein
MKKLIAPLALALILGFSADAQKLKTRTGMVRFFSESPIENIEALNKQVSSVLVTESGEFAFLVPIKAFVFDKALMQEHFNENYMESGEFPTAKFNGSIENLEAINFEEDGEYEAVFAGTMNIHGVDKKISEPVTVVVKGKTITVKTKFMVLCSDYGVDIPSAKKDNINNQLEVTVNVEYNR